MNSALALVNNGIQDRDDPIRLLEAIPNIVLAIELAQTPDEISGIRGMVKTFQTYLKETLPGVMADRNEIFTHVHKTGVLLIEASAKAGAIWQGLENKRTQQDNQYASANVRKLSWYDVGFKSDKDATRCVRAAELDEADRWQYYEECRVNSKEPTMNGIENAWREFYGRPHIAENSGEQQWYTPSHFIEAARTTMGSIDLDPASTKIANKIVKAEQYYTAETNGLQYVWKGNVWLNPPYDRELVVLFCEKLCEEISLNNVKQACVLVNNATDTAWFQGLMEFMASICLLKGRVKFLNKDLMPDSAPLQGQAILYFGTLHETFHDNFKEYGKVLYAR